MIAHGYAQSTGADLWEGLHDDRLARLLHDRPLAPLRVVAAPGTGGFSYRLCHPAGTVPVHLAVSALDVEDAGFCHAARF